MTSTKHVPELISVIVPVFNTEKYLGRCLDSILNNTYRKLEIICINDGSEDSSLAILREYESKDSRVIVINKSNDGVSTARNAGMQIASGEYIAFVDSDDWVHSRYFEYLFQAAEQVSADLAFCDYVIVDAEGELSEVAQGARKLLSAKEWMTGSNHKLSVWKSLYQHKLLAKLSFDENLSSGEDTLFNLQMIASKENPTIVFLDSALYAYYQRSGSLTDEIDEYAHLDIFRRMRSVIDEMDYVCNKKVVYGELFKRALLIRYIFSIIGNDELVQECNHVAKGCLNDIPNTGYRLLYWFPWTYRMLRIFRDRSTLHYEKALRQRVANQSEEKKKAN